MRPLPEDNLPWMLRAYADRCVRRDWSSGTQQDREWGAALALCIDKFARDWVATNCAGRAALANEQEGK